MEGKVRILLVDDDEDDYVMTRDLLAEIDDAARYELEWAATYGAGLTALGRRAHDVYLLDYRLGERDGLEMLREAVAGDCKAPIIVLTGQHDREVDMEAMRAGAVDYLIKGRIDAPTLERAIRYAVARKRVEEELEESRAELLLKNQALAALNAEIRRGVIGSIQMFSAMLETYDEALGGHSARVASLARALAARLGLGGEELEAVEIAARLHDVGLVCLPEHIAKVGAHDGYKLGEQEKKLFRRHPEYGQRVVGGHGQFTEVGRVIRGHHERYDGLGYPDRLAGEAIPLGARIIAIVSRYDRIAEAAGGSNSRGDLRERRRQEAIAYLRGQQGGRLDPHLTSDFLEMLGVSDEGQEAAPLEVKLADLREGMVLAVGISTKGGMLIIGAGTVLQPLHLARLENFNQLDPITQKIFVRREGQTH
jgi:response regulator RpfG family c-di-GMP phosphodiesterase